VITFGEVLTQGSPRAKKALFEALIEEITVQADNRLIPAFRIPIISTTSEQDQPDTDAEPPDDGDPVRALPCLVELLSRYSNRADLLKPLLDVLRRIEENDQTDEPGIEAGTPSLPGRRIQDRLAPDDLTDLIDLYRSGATRRQVAEKFGVGEQTVKYILRKHHVRHPGSDAPLRRRA